jgi:hypothetical protein
MFTKKWVLGAVVLFVSVIVIVSAVRAVSPQANLIKNSSLGLKDTTPVIWINDRAIPRGTIIGLADTFMSMGAANKEDAYQNALNLIVQNSIFLQEATKRGLIPTDSEVDGRVQELLNEAKENNQQLRDMYIAQASGLGITWDSKEFEAYLKKQQKEVLPAEKLNEEISKQAKGDEQQFNEIKAQLLSELILTASISLDKDALPEEAKNLHAPQAAELPAVQATQLMP